MTPDELTVVTTSAIGVSAKSHSTVAGLLCAI